MDNVYTHSQIEEAWETYQNAHCWRYLKEGGKEAVRMTAPDPNKEAILNCRMVKVQHVMSFPRYLKIEYDR